MLVGLTILLKVNYIMALKREKFEEVSNEMTSTVEGTETTVGAADVLAANDTVVETSEPVAAPAAAAAAVAVRPAASTSLAARNEAADQAKAFAKQLADLQGGDFSFGSYRVFKGSNGELAEMSGEKVSCGRWMKVVLLNWNTHFEISPSTDDKSAKEFVAYSLDGITIDYCIGEEQRAQWAGKPVKDYVEYLRNEEDFAKADVRPFIDMACALLGTDSGDGPVGTVIQVTLSSSSMQNFKRYFTSLQSTARCVAMGLAGFSLPENPFEFYLVREVASKGSNRWTKIQLMSSLPSKL